MAWESLGGIWSPLSYLSSFHWWCFDGVDVLERGVRLVDPNVSFCTCYSRYPPRLSRHLAFALSHTTMYHMILQYAVYFELSPPRLIRLIRV